MGQSGRFSNPRFGQAVYAWLVVLLTVGGLLTAAAPSAEEPRCFSDDLASRLCVEGRLLEFWLSNGGETAFGVPLTAMALEQTPDGIFPVQYFEHARMELHSENVAPNDVLLGRIGAERLEVLGRAADMAPAAPLADCQHVAITGHNICGDLLQYWRAHGLNLDDSGTPTEGESIALFGLPITEAATEKTAGGLSIHSQWFERVHLVQFADGTVAATTLGRDIVGARETFAPPAEVSQLPESMPTPADSVPPTDSVPPAATPPAEPAVDPVPNVAPPVVPCDHNVPTPANGLQMWLAQPLPGDTLEDQAVVCVRLIVAGEAVHDAGAQVYRYYGGEMRPTIAQSTGVDGVASFIFYIGPGSLGMPSHLEAVVSFGGIAYSATLVPDE